MMIYSIDIAIIQIIEEGNNATIGVFRSMD